MTTHAMIYLKHFGFDVSDFIACENCGKRAQDIHHIHGRGRGKDVIENLQALCRDCHKAAHGEAKTYLHPDVMQTIHDEYLKEHGGAA